MSMIKRSLIVVALSGAFACSHVNDAEREQEERAAAERQQAQRTPERTAQARRATAVTPRNPTPPAVEPEKAPIAAGVESDRPTKPPDNTGINERDRSPAALTPMDQGNSAEDLRITADIRKALMKEDALSFTAKNVKVITRGGYVLLRGPVKTTIEKERIDAIARAAAGVIKVDDQLEVEPSGRD